jgi:hypothetical protein
VGPILAFVWPKLDQDWQSKYNVTPRRVRVTIFAIEKQLVLNILYVCL